MTQKPARGVVLALLGVLLFGAFAFADTAAAAPQSTGGVTLVATPPAASVGSPARVTTKAVPVRPATVVDTQYWVDGNVAFNNDPDYDVDVLWYKNTSQCSPACYVPKYVQVTATGPFPCDIKRIDADYRRNGDGGYVQRIGEAFSGGFGQQTIGFTSGTWSYDSMNPYVAMKASTYGTASGIPGCSPWNNTGYGTIVN